MPDPQALPPSTLPPRPAPRADDPLSDPPEIRARVRATAAAIAGLGLLTFLSSLSIPFFIDDLGAIRDNPTIRRLWPIGPVFTPPPGTSVTARPLVNASLALNYAIGGLDVRGYHVVNMLLHVGSALLLFGIARRTLIQADPGDWSDRIPVRLAAAIAVLWTVHPLVSEAVAYTIQRTELMYAFFALLTLYTFIRGCGSLHEWRWWSLSIAACALGMGSKESMVVVPVLVLLWDRAFLAGSFAQAWRVHRRYFVLLFACWLVLAGVLLTAPPRPGAGLASGVTVGQYLLTQANVIGHYLRLCVWPDPLSVYYHWPLARGPGDLGPPGLVTLAALVLSAWVAWRRPMLGFVVLAFWLLLAPSSSVVPIATELAAERRMYLPLACVISLAVLAGVRIMGALASRSPHLRHWPPRLASAAVAVVVGACVVRTLARLNDLQTVRAVYESVIRAAPDSPVGYNGLGQVLRQEADQVERTGGGSPQARGQASELRTKARESFEQALARDPRYDPARINYARALEQANDYPRAQAQYEQIIRENPGYAPAYNNLAAVQSLLGQRAAAIENFRKAIERDPLLAMAYSNLGRTLALEGRLDEALVEHRRAIALEPDNPDFVFQLGRTLFQQRDLAGAKAAFEQALALDPGHAQARVQLNAVRQQLKPQDPGGP